MIKTIRPYQKQIIDRIMESFRKGNKKILCTLPTGAGKTFIAKQIIEMGIAFNRVVWFVVNRVELVDQSYEEFEGKCSVIKAGSENLFDKSNNIQIVMSQTWNARSKKLNIKEPNLIIIDEIHDGSSGKIQKNLIAKYPNAKIIGLTATPICEKGYLLPGFDDFINDIQTKDLQNQGFLVQDRWIVPKKTMLDLRGINTKNNDYDESQLFDTIKNEQVLSNIVEKYIENCENRKTIIFCLNIQHAELMKQSFIKEGISCDIIHSKINDLENKRKIILGKLKSGETKVLCNVGILTTGFNEPSVDCIIFARPTKVLRLFIQMAGRGLRLFPEKKDCLFLDCANLFYEHGRATMRREFSIDKGDKKKLQKKRDSEKSLEKICPNCEEIVDGNETECPFCHYEFPITKKKIEFIDGEVMEISSNPSEFTCHAILKRYMQYFKNSQGQKYHWKASDYLMIKMIEKHKSNFENIEHKILQCIKKNYNPYWILH